MKIENNSMTWEKVEEGYWILTGSQYFMQKGDLFLAGMDGNGWWVYKDGIRLIGYPNFQEAKGYANFHAKADAQEDRAYAEAERTPNLKEYEWTVEASGLIEATSLEEAREILLNEADGMVADDRKYWLMKVEKEVV